MAISHLIFRYLCQCWYISAHHFDSMICTVPVHNHRVFVRTSVVLSVSKHDHAVTECM